MLYSRMAFVAFVSENLMLLGIHRKNSNFETIINKSEKVNLT